MGENGRYTDDAGCNRLCEIPESGIPVLHYTERKQENLQVMQQIRLQNRERGYRRNNYDEALSLIGR